MSTEAGGAAAAAAIANAIKASGAIDRVKPDQFLVLLAKEVKPLVVHSRGGLFVGAHRYLMSYRGLIFFTKTSEPLPLPPDSETVESKKIWVPQ